MGCFFCSKEMINSYSWEKQVSRIIDYLNIISDTQDTLKVLALEHFF